LALPFTVLVLVAITNAVNLSDGLDGLAGGIALLAASSLLLFAYGAGDTAVLIELAALLGAILGFLRFNTFPARLFMGDTGSQFLGFSVAVLAIVVTQDASYLGSPVVPILLLGLPILDTLTVMVGRLARGQSPFVADRTHLHHRLLDSGLTQYEAVSLIYGAQFLLILAAYLLRDSSALLLVYAVFCGLLLLGVWMLEHHHEALKRRPPHLTPIGRFGAWAHRTRIFTAVPVQVLSICIPLFLVAGALAAAPGGGDIGLLATALFCALLLALVFKPIPFYAVERLSAYTTAVVVTYLVARSPGLTEPCPLCLPLLYGFIALLAAVWVRFSSGAFQVSSLDVLILIGALVAPALRGFGLQNLGILALQSVVLFYAIEILIQERERHWDALRIGVLATLAVLAVRGLGAWGQV
jgi:UDP-GlcNAc:undecaprenyl-phosphate GlcNAc-1-phosphate transferase